jgi:hypothetical protein
MLRFEERFISIPSNAFAFLSPENFHLKCHCDYFKVSVQRLTSCLANVMIDSSPSCMASTFDHSQYVKIQDENLLGIEGAWGEFMGLVHQDSDSGILPELTIPFFRFPEFHEGTSQAPSFSSANISNSLPTFASSNLPPAWEDVNVMPLPTRHSYTEGFNDWGVHQAYNDVGWEVSPTIFGSSGSWNEHGSVPSGDGGDAPATVDIFHMHNEELEYRPELLHPSSASLNWIDHFPPTMSRTQSVTSVASFQTAREEPLDIMTDESSPVTEQFPMDGTFEVSSNELEAPIEQPNPNFVLMQMDPTTKRMLAESGPGMKSTKGRKGPLNPEAKKGAAKMRKVKACESCRRRKTPVISSLFRLL